MPPGLRIAASADAAGAATPGRRRGVGAITPTSSGQILVLSREPLAAALIGMLVELENYEPVFAEPGERPIDALARVRPVVVILLDGALEEARSDLFYIRAAKRKAGVVLFAGGRADDIDAIARAHGALSIVVPTDRATLSGVLSQASTRYRVRSGADRRRPSTRRNSDGILVYRDRAGEDWYVYDRRAGERRASVADAADEPRPYRAFVNALGEEWRYPHPSGKVPAATATALERQLAQATRVE